MAWTYEMTVYEVHISHEKTFIMLKAVQMKMTVPSCYHKNISFSMIFRTSMWHCSFLCHLHEENIPLENQNQILTIPLNSKVDTDKGTENY